MINKYIAGTAGIFTNVTILWNNQKETKYKSVTNAKMSISERQSSKDERQGIGFRQCFCRRNNYYVSQNQSRVARDASRQVGGAIASLSKVVPADVNRRDKSYESAP